jgi:NADPH:quinone reductase-like Zn-dependent oxidoreductase
MASRARISDTVAVLGIGGLGHLAVQFASKMGFHTIAIARGTAKEPLALQLGARRYIDSAAVANRGAPAYSVRQLGKLRLRPASFVSARPELAFLGHNSSEGSARSW